MKPQHNTTVHSSTWLILAASVAFFIFGFSDILKGSAVAEMVLSLDVDYAIGGTILGTTYFGFFFGTLSSVFLLKKHSVAQILAVSVGIVTLGIGLFGFTNSLVLVLGATFITGVGCGLIDVSANLVVQVASPPERVGGALNQLSFFHGLGAIISPLFAAAVLAYSKDWHGIYRLAAVVLIIGFLLVLKGVLSSKIPTTIANRSSSKVVISKRVLLLGGFLFWYMTIEAGISGWLIAYIRDIGLSARIATTYLSLFFVMLTVGRFLSSRYVDRLGLLKTITIHLVSLLALLLLATLVPALHILFPLTGICMAPLFPTTVALLIEDLGEMGVHTTGVFFSIAGLGGLFGPWLIGLGMRVFSIQAGISLLNVFSLLFLVFIFLYMRQRRSTR